MVTNDIMLDVHQCVSSKDAATLLMRMRQVASDEVRLEIKGVTSFKIPSSPLFPPRAIMACGKSHVTGNSISSIGYQTSNNPILSHTASLPLIADSPNLSAVRCRTVSISFPTDLEVSRPVLLQTTYEIPSSPRILASRDLPTLVLLSMLSRQDGKTQQTMPNVVEDDVVDEVLSTPSSSKSVGKKCKNAHAGDLDDLCETLIDHESYVSSKLVGTTVNGSVRVRDILRKKFCWKSFPELELYLIKHRTEYFACSHQLNYTSEQKRYNNCLTQGLLDLAADEGYIFEGFTFAAIRDRIRCYYKSYIQAAKKKTKVCCKQVMGTTTHECHGSRIFDKLFLYCQCCCVGV